MKKKINYSMLLLSISALFLAACTSNTEVEKEVNEEAAEKEELQEVEKEEEVLPEVSQAISTFPWDEKDDFLKAKEKHDTNVLIAGYTAVFDQFPPEEEENVKIASSMIRGTVLEPGEVFSQNEIAGPYTEEKGYKEGDVYVNGEVMKDFGGGVCNMATTLYNAAIASDLEIVERHNHSMPVPYVPYGQDAAVAYGFKDFQFKNSTEAPMLIWAELVENRLYVGFYGKEAAPKITWEHDILDEEETSTQYITNPDLKEGEENVLVEGMPGKTVHSKLKIEHEDGEIEEKEIGDSIYNPLHHLIEKSE